MCQGRWQEQHGDNDENANDDDLSSGHNEQNDTEERRDEDYSSDREDEATDRNSNNADEDEDEDEDEDSSSGHNEQNGTEEWRDEDYSSDREDEAADRNSNNADEDEDEDETATGTWRKTRPGPKKFEVTIKTRTWKKIKPHAGSVQLQKPWTDVLYKAFALLSFKYQHVKCRKSRKQTAPYFRALAVCTFDDCSAKYTFTIRTKPKPFQNSIDIHVVRFWCCSEIPNSPKEEKLQPQ